MCPLIVDKHDYQIGIASLYTESKVVFRRCEFTLTGLQCNLPLFYLRFNVFSRLPYLDYYNIVHPVLPQYSH